MLPEVQIFTAYFDMPIKALAVKEFMETNDVTFDQATTLLNYSHGVDFLLCLEGEANAH